MPASIGGLHRQWLERNVESGLVSGGKLLQNTCWEYNPTSVCMDGRVAVPRCRNVGELIPYKAHRLEKTGEPNAVHRAAGTTGVDAPCGPFACAASSTCGHDGTVRYLE